MNPTTHPKPEIRNKIEKFLESDRTDYMEFWNTISDITGTQVARNSQKKEQILEKREPPKHEKGWMKEGIYGKNVGQPPYQELDFEKFSFHMMKHHAEKKHNQLLLDIADILMDQPETWRRKRLRVNLFESLQYVESAVFDHELYLDILEDMLEARQKVNNIIESEGYKVLTLGFDSFSFLASDEQAKELQEKVNSQLEVSSLSLERFDNVVRFRNIADFEKDGNWQTSMTNGTGESDEIKKKIVKHLRTQDFTEAYKEVQKAKNSKQYDITTKTLKSYTATITEIKNEVEQNR